MYALGIWTMIGSFAYFKYTGRFEDTPVKKEEVQEQEDPNQVVHRTPHNKTVITYKKDFVPYSSRIYTFIRSFSSDPGTGDNEK
ncbi:small integral membrane protein 26-like protein [Lates japonicus]|uniref:Small integral membrane protein 26-like protein n=1 Tax=Lates japonicus TaxID=270547 RepID=A0AAD3MVS4_LATJO|nr:small integral membrane protein 26-like protein [Lates japonicus]